MTQLRCGGIFSNYITGKFPRSVGLCGSERIFKIGQYLAKINKSLVACFLDLRYKRILQIILLINVFTVLSFYASFRVTAGKLVIFVVSI